MRRNWWETIDERQRMFRDGEVSGKIQTRIKKPYKWGAKAFLSSFEVGECREYHEDFEWKSLISIASRMKKDFGCIFFFNSADYLRYITRAK